MTGTHTQNPSPENPHQIADEATRTREEPWTARIDDSLHVRLVRVRARQGRQSVTSLGPIIIGGKSLSSGHGNYKRQ